MILISDRIGEKGLSKGGIIRICHEFDGGILKCLPDITVWRHTVCRVMANGDREGRTFLSHPQTKNLFFFLLTIKVSFVMHYFMSILVLQSSWSGRKSWPFCYYCLTVVLLL